ncbi:hypothetical protein FHR81_002783 [Actinoalloteichus hoggarensis]|uniref:Uncharacterized protein n=1 Tax=Actinoalloteichus hoggarensis TaxID=1470176 RepID=A0A221VXV0_9PSEU|nr:hypothetical protein [Actinoalloteichus hoggarensis]ASO18379.1 hypothetical protein AHOG_03610 [Actinoalloteichus hoggarensis]MBB5921743.1 hypothetical protein [Actinoalloteichus hoggarensis]
MKPRAVLVGGVLLLAASALLLVLIAGIPAGWAVAVALPPLCWLLLSLRVGRTAAAVWQPTRPPEDSIRFVQAATLAGRFTEASADRRRFRTRLQPRLRAVALTALRGRPETAGVTDLHDPRAVAALDPRLHRLLTDPAATLPAPRVLAALLAELDDGRAGPS